MLVVPLQAIPSQTLQVQLDNQAFELSVYQLAYGLFIDVSVAGTLVIGGVICLNLNLIVRSQYLGVLGDFAFCDLQGTTDPVYTGLGARYQLLYLSPTDIDSLPLPPGVS